MPPDPITLLVPMLIAAPLWLAAWRPWRRDAAGRGWAALGALAIAGGYIAGHWAIAGWPPYPPARAVHWLPYLAAAGGLAGLASPWWGRHAAMRWPLVLALMAGGAWLQFRPLTQHTWSTLESVAWLALIAVLGAVACERMGALGARRPGGALAFGWWATATALSVSLVLGGSALLGQLASSLAIVCGVAMVLGWWGGARAALTPGAALAFILPAAGLIWQGHFYAELSLFSALLLSAAPLAAWTGEIPWATRTVWRGALLRAGGPAALAGLALVHAVWVWSQTPNTGY